MCDTAFTPKVPWQKRCSAKCNSVVSNTRNRRDPSQKTCRTCALTLPIERFQVAHRHCMDCEQLHESGFKRCKGCHEVKELDQFHARPNRASGRDSRCKQCRSEESKQRNSNPEKQARNRDNKYRQKYGIGEEEVEAMRQAQGNCCAICGKQPPRLNVDHDHKTGAVRSLLCLNCNALLGHCDDEISVLQNAIAYIERHKNHAYIRA